MPEAGRSGRGEEPEPSPGAPGHPPVPGPSGRSGAATYVYGVTPADAAPPAVPGIGTLDPVVRLVRWRGLGALVTEVLTGEVGSARSLRAHARALDAAIRLGPVVPLRFATLVDDPAAVVTHVLRPLHDRFVALLDRLRDHVELAVRVAYDEDAAVRHAMAADPAIAARHAALAGAAGAAAHHERIALGEHVAAALERHRDGLAGEVVEALGAVADDVRAAEPASPRVVLDGSFLVRRGGLDAFRDALAAATRAHDDLNVRLVGPLPPYSFSDLEPVG